MRAGEHGPVPSATSINIIDGVASPKGGVARHVQPEGEEYLQLGAEVPREPEVLLKP